MTTTISNTVDNAFDPEYELSCDTTSYVDILASDTLLNDELGQQEPNHSSTTTTTTSRDHPMSVISLLCCNKFCYLSRSLYGTICNFINCIIGAGAIGLGGAIASSGGIISCIVIILISIMVKLSIDLVIQLSISSFSSSSSNQPNSITSTLATTSQHATNPRSSSLLSYEELGYYAYGNIGKYFVMISKFTYSFGCMVAYTIIIYDNFSSTICIILNIPTQQSSDHGISHYFNMTMYHYVQQWFYYILSHNVWCTWFISSTVILPLCCMRDMSSLASTSCISVIAILSIVSIVIYLWYTDVDHSYYEYDEVTRTTTKIIDLHETLETGVLYFYNILQRTFSKTTYQHWLEIRWIGLLSNMGTFVFSFVCHHTVHLTYESLHRDIRQHTNNMYIWKFISSIAMGISCIISMTLGLFCYMTFWERTESDVFPLYPADTKLIVYAKLLLCVTMLLTFPLPFFTCRDIIILLFCIKPSTTSTDEMSGTSPSRNGIRSKRTSNNNNDLRAIDGDLFGDLNEPLLLSPIEIDEEMNHNNISLQDADKDGLVQSLFGDNDAADGSCNSNNENIIPTDIDPIHASLIHRSSSMDVSVISTRVIEMINTTSTSMLLPGEERQLKLLYHILLTCKIWFVITAIAISAPNLGDVLDFVGCCSGTMIAFILPGMFAIRIQGYSTIAILILLFGGIIGIVGTFCSIRKLFHDMI